jgi:hypothetical protein
MVFVLNTIRKLGIHAQTLGTVLSRGVKADAHGATQVFGRGGQAVARGSCLSHVLGRGAEAAARGAVPCALQVLGPGAEDSARGAARCASHASLLMGDMNTASKLGPLTQTDRGTCPGVGL